MKIKKLDKFGWIRVLEAFLAITLILSFVVYTIATNNSNIDISKSVYDRESNILNLISHNESLRKDIINVDLISSPYGTSDKVNDSIKPMLPSTWGYSTKICLTDVICNVDGAPNNKDVYNSEVLISSDQDIYNPRKLVLSVWMKD